MSKISLTLVCFFVSCMGPATLGAQGNKKNFEVANDLTFRAADIVSEGTRYTCPPAGPRKLKNWLPSKVSRTTGSTSKNAKRPRNWRSTGSTSI